MYFKLSRATPENSKILYLEGLKIKCKPIITPLPPCPLSMFFQKENKLVSQKPKSKIEEDLREQKSISLSTHQKNA